MKKILLALLTMLILTGCSNHADRPLSEWKLEEIRRLVEENCRIGDSPDETTAFLSRHSFEFSPSIGRDGRNQISACIRKPRPWFSFVFSEGYFLIFQFDKDDKLESFTVREVFTGP